MVTMHLARAVDCRAVIGFLHLKNYACNINVFTKSSSCKKCGLNEAFPYLVQCKDDFSCIKDIDYVDLCNAIEKQLNKTKTLETDVVMPNPIPANGIDDYLKRFGRIPDKEIC